MQVVAMDSIEWSKYAEDAHLVVFDELRPASMNRIDFAMITEDEGVPQCYMTCREFDSESVYMQMGGAFPSSKGTPKSYHSFEMFVLELTHKYKRATILIQNVNTPMIKFALKLGMLIIGTRTVRGEIFVELLIEFRGQNA